jgi:hypothetical protein
MPKAPSIDDPAYWRQRATDSRRMAEQLDDPVQKKTMLEIADGYDQLAELAQSRMNSKAK